jgi:hypothetical protein
VLQGTRYLTHISYCAQMRTPIGRSWLDCSIHKSFVFLLVGSCCFSGSHRITLDRARASSRCFRIRLFFVRFIRRLRTASDRHRCSRRHIYFAILCIFGSASTCFWSFQFWIQYASNQASCYCKQASLKILQTKNACKKKLFKHLGPQAVRLKRKQHHHEDQSVQWGRENLQDP